MINHEEEILVYQGSTKYISFNYLDSEGKPIDLTGASLAFAYRQSGEAVRITPSVAGSVITVKIEASATATMLGTYDYEIKLKDLDGDIDTIAVGTFEVKTSLIPVFDVTP